MKVKLRWVVAGIMVAALGLATAARADEPVAEGSFQRTLKVTGAVDLEVKTGSGSIQVRSGAADTVQVSAKIRARESRHSSLSAEEKVKRLEANPPIEQNGNVIRIGQLEDRELRDNVSISYELVVPAETRLRSATGSGSQTIEGLRNEVEVTTGSGGLTISNVGADLRASTGSGSIEARTVEGNLRASTGSGSIRGYGVRGTVSASTGSGSIAIEKSGPGDVEATTGSGGVEVRAVKGAVRVRTGSGSIRVEGEPTGEWNVHTASGGVTIRLPAEQGFELNARSASGSIHSAHPVTVMGTIGRRELRGKVRGGGPLLSLSTSSGSIRVE
jgi:DUF4097 and DUF4098 domain-containing protein YvlB